MVKLKGNLSFWEYPQNIFWIREITFVIFSPVTPVTSATSWYFICSLETVKPLMHAYNIYFVWEFRFLLSYSIWSFNSETTSDSGEIGYLTVQRLKFTSNINSLLQHFHGYHFLLLLLLTRHVTITIHEEVRYFLL